MNARGAVLALALVAVTACATLGRAARDPAVAAVDALKAEAVAHEAAEASCSALETAITLKAVKRTQAVSDALGQCAAFK